MKKMLAPEWKISKDAKDYYDTRSARFLRRIAKHVYRFLQKWGLDHIDIVAMDVYISIRANHCNEVVVNDYTFMPKED